MVDSYPSGPAPPSPRPLDQDRLGVLFESVVVHANDVVLVTEAEPIDLPDGGPRVLYVNPAFTKMTGYEAHEIIGLTPRLLQSPKTDRAELDRLRAALVAWESVEVELLNLRKDGSEFWVQINITPVCDETGWWTHWIAIQRDITARRGRELAAAALLANSSDLVLDLDGRSVIEAVSPTVQRLLARDPDELVGTALLEHVHPADAAATGAFLGDAQRPRPARSSTVELRLRHRDEGWRWFEIGMVAGLDAAGVVLSGADITARRRSEEALQVANDRFRSAFADAPIGMALTEPSGRFVQVNAELCELLGRDEDELLGLGVQDVTHPDDVGPGERQRRALLGGAITRHRYETRFLHADGSLVGVLHSSSVVAGADGAPAHLVDHVEDITERKAFEAQLRHQAMHDELTGLPNRALLGDRLDWALRRAERPGGELAVLFLDFDRFKVVNDSLGHRAGDDVLVSAARRLEALLRPGDTVARFGGDEFVVLCEDCSAEQAASMAARVAAAFSAPLTVGEVELMLTASIGIALSRPGATADALLRYADAAMYSAKERGRGRFEVFDEELGRRATARLQTENELREAIDDGQLCLEYQPMLRLVDGATVGLEALLRWRHPRRGLLPPAEFIGLAEESGLIGGLGDWVLTAAMREAARRREADPEEPPVLWVNLSAHQLRDPRFVAAVAGGLQEHGLPGAALGLEITESALMDDVDLARRALGALRDLGVALAIDDFGTGYSSLSHLARFPVDTVKIDRSFVSGMDEDDTRRESFAVVSAVVGLAHALELDVVAEGIETADQARGLHGLGCDLGQGFLLGRPSPSGAPASQAPLRVQR